MILAPRGKECYKDEKYTREDMIEER